MIAFLNWYMWVWYASTILVYFSQECISSSYSGLGELLLPATLTLALCLDYNFNHWLIKEPVSSNPLKLIYRVIYFAWKNKYPRQRSAVMISFTLESILLNRNLVDLSLRKKLKM